MSFMRSMGGDIWEPEDRVRSQGIMDRRSTPRRMEAYKSMLKYQPPGAINYFIAEVVDAFTQGKVFAAWQWARDRRDDDPGRACTAR